MKTTQKTYLTILLTLFAVLLVFGAGYAVYYSGDWVTVHYLTPDDEITVKVRTGKEHTIHEPVEVDGYTFLHWRDEQGNPEKRETVTVYEDTWYAADYAIALISDEHPVYLFPDENGYYRPQDPMLRSDAVTMLHILLGKPKGDGTFLDVPKKAPYAKAAAALRELGILNGSRLHPDEAITRGELLEILSALFPEAKEEYVFSDLEKGQPFYEVCCVAAEHGWIESGEKVKAEADHVLTRAETATLINRITGRSERPGARLLQVGSPVDLYPSEEGYWDMVEACIPHSFTTIIGKEIWTDSTPAEKLPEGKRMIGWRLSWIGADGRVLRDADVGNLDCREMAVTGAVQMEVDTGDITFDGSAARIDADTDVGSLKFLLPGTAADWAMELETDVGDITVDGIHQGDRYETRGGQYQLEAETDTGDVEVAFQ